MLIPMAVRTKEGLRRRTLSLLGGHELRRVWRATGSEDAVGTTGRMELSPNAVNSVPRGAVLEIDVRDIDGERRDATVASIVKEAAAIAKRRKVRHTVAVINQDPPAICGQEVRRTAVAWLLRAAKSICAMPCGRRHPNATSTTLISRHSPQNHAIATGKLALRRTMWKSSRNVMRPAMLTACSNLPVAQDACHDA